MKIWLVYKDGVEWRCAVSKDGLYVNMVVIN